MIYSDRFFVALVITFFIEIPLLFLTVKYILKNKVFTNLRIIETGLIASGFTLPYVWFVIPLVINGRNTIFISELFAVIIESILYKILLDIKSKQALLLSLGLNTLSYFIGKLVMDVLKST
jgi:hypothetical protein